MAIVVVGDRQKIEPSLKELNLGEIQARDLQGEPVANAVAAKAGSSQ
jgi:hypothetical protein